METNRMNSHFMIKNVFEACDYFAYEIDDIKKLAYERLQSYDLQHTRKLVFGLNISVTEKRALLKKLADTHKNYLVNEMESGYEDPFDDWAVEEALIMYTCYFILYCDALKGGQNQ